MLPGGFNGPFDVTVGHDGHLYIADGPFMYGLAPGAAPRTVGMLFTPGSPGYVRGLATADGGGFVVTTSGGTVALYRPEEQVSEILASGFDQLYGVTTAPGGAVIAADLGAPGRVVSIRAGETEELAAGLSLPIDVALTADGDCLVSESGAGRVVKIVRGGVETVIDGLQRPHGIVVRGNHLYIVDAGAKAVIEFDLVARTRRTIAADLPVGAPPGVIAQAVTRHSAAFRADGAIRRDCRWRRWHAVCLRRWRGQYHRVAA